MNQCRTAILIVYLASLAVALVYVPWDATGQVSDTFEAQVTLGRHPIWWSPPSYIEIIRSHEIVARKIGPDTEVVAFEAAAITVLAAIPFFLASTRRLTSFYNLVTQQRLRPHPIKRNAPSEVSPQPMEPHRSVTIVSADKLEAGRDRDVPERPQDRPYRWGRFQGGALVFLPPWGIVMSAVGGNWIGAVSAGAVWLIYLFPMGLGIQKKRPYALKMIYGWLGLHVLLVLVLLPLVKNPSTRSPEDVRRAIYTIVLSLAVWIPSTVYYFKREREFY
jgi:hypothetical protein